MFDDVYPGKIMSAAASPPDFLKNIFTVDHFRILQCRNHDADLFAGPRVFTSNAPDFDKFVALRDGKSVDIHDLNAVRARLVLGIVRSRLYTDDQATSIAEDRVTDFTEQKATLAYMKANGLL